MKTSLALIATVSALTTYQGLAFADDITLGIPAYGGTGCPQGSASVTLAQGGSALSILYDRFVAEAGGTTRKRLDRKFCGLSVPIHVPSGISVSIIKTDIRGFTAVPEGGRAQFNAEYFFAGEQGPKYTKDTFGPANEDFLISNAILNEAVVWSPCGQDSLFRINASMLAVSNSMNEQAMATVDSSDIAPSMLFQLQWKTCGDQNPDGEGPPLPIDLSF